MKKFLNNQKILIAALMALILAMGGSTYAWFTHYDSDKFGDMGMGKVSVKVDSGFARRKDYNVSGKIASMWEIIPNSNYNFVVPGDTFLIGYKVTNEGDAAIVQLPWFEDGLMLKKFNGLDKADPNKTNDYPWNAKLISEISPGIDSTEYYTLAQWKAFEENAHLLGAGGDALLAKEREIIAKRGYYDLLLKQLITHPIDSGCTDYYDPNDPATSHDDVWMKAALKATEALIAKAGDISAADGLLISQKGSYLAERDALAAIVDADNNLADLSISSADLAFLYSTGTESSMDSSDPKYQEFNDSIWPKDGIVLKSTESYYDKVNNVPYYDENDNELYYVQYKSAHEGKFLNVRTELIYGFDGFVKTHPWDDPDFNAALFRDTADGRFYAWMLPGDEITIVYDLKFDPDLNNSFQQAEITFGGSANFAKAVQLTQATDTGPEAFENIFGFYFRDAINAEYTGGVLSNTVQDLNLVEHGLLWFGSSDYKAFWP